MMKNIFTWLCYRCHGGQNDSYALCTHCYV